MTQWQKMCCYVVSIMREMLFCRIKDLFLVCLLYVHVILIHITSRRLT